MNSVHILQSYFFKPHFNIIIFSVPTLPSGTFASGFQTKTLYACLAFHASCMAACVFLLPNMHSLQLYESVNAVR
jgi:hypothetical protein